MQKILFNSFSFCLLLVSATSYALPFTIVPKSGTQLPTTVSAGTPVMAYYTVLNNTLEQRNGNYTKYLPPNVTQVTSGGTFADTCSASFTLAANGQTGASCTLQLSVSGAVNGSDPNPHNHLFVCFPGGVTCSGTNYPLNVTQSPNKQHQSYAYISNATGTIAYCVVNPDGSFGACNSTTGGVPFSNPQGIAINPAGTYIFLIDQTMGPSNAYSCPINNDGSISTCTIAASSLNGGRFIGVNPAGTFAYISNFETIYYCPINANGSFGTCNSTGNFNSSQGIVINPAGTYAYVTNSSNNTVSYCPVHANGTLGSCSTISGFLNPEGITVNPEGTYVYVANWGNGSSNSGTVSYCTINGDGTLGSCNTAGTNFNYPFGIAINPTGTYAYISDFYSNNVYLCPIISGGSFGTCTTTGNTFNLPFDIAVS